MQNILLAFAAGYIVATVLQKSESGPIVATDEMGKPVLVNPVYNTKPPVVKGIAGHYFPIHRGMENKFLQV